MLGAPSTSRVVRLPPPALHAAAAGSKAVPVAFTCTQRSAVQAAPRFVPPFASGATPASCVAALIVTVGLGGTVTRTCAIVAGPDAKDAIAAQLTPPSLLQRNAKAAGANPDAKTVARTLHFILPSLKAGETATYLATIGKETPSLSGYRWEDTKGKHATLSYADRPVLRYMYEAIDESTPARRELTYKVFHHLYDPTGKRIVTKGAGGQFTHHRGLFYGFNRISYAGGKKKCDTWHCRGAHLSHQGIAAAEVGTVLGRHVVEVHWHGPAKEVFATEQREMTVYNARGGQMVEFASRLASQVGPVKLDGDPQHAGFQFRADNEVAAKTKGQTYYLRPDGQGKPGETRNWAAGKPDPRTVNLPFNAMSFVLGDTRYTAVYLDHPNNPKEARYSERDYGRFGSYFEFELDKDKPLELNYRLWLQAGEMTGDRVATLKK